MSADIASEPAGSLIPKRRRARRENPYKHPCKDPRTLELFEEKPDWALDKSVYVRGGEGCGKGGGYFYWIDKDTDLTRARALNVPMKQTKRKADDSVLDSESAQAEQIHMPKQPKLQHPEEEEAIESRPPARLQIGGKGLRPRVGGKDPRAQLGGKGLQAYTHYLKDTPQEDDETSAATETYHDWPDYEDEENAYLQPRGILGSGSERQRQGQDPNAHECEGLESVTRSQVDADRQVAPEQTISKAILDAQLEAQMAVQPVDGEMSVEAGDALDASYPNHNDDNIPVQVLESDSYGGPNMDIQGVVSYGKAENIKQPLPLYGESCVPSFADKDAWYGIQDGCQFRKIDGIYYDREYKRLTIQPAAPPQLSLSATVISVPVLDETGPKIRFQTVIQEYRVRYPHLQKHDFWYVGPEARFTTDKRIIKINDALLMQISAWDRVISWPSFAAACFGVSRENILRGILGYINAHKGITWYSILFHHVVCSAIMRLGLQIDSEEGELRSSWTVGTNVNDVFKRYLGNLVWLLLMEQQPRFTTLVTKLPWHQKVTKRTGWFWSDGRELKEFDVVSDSGVYLESVECGKQGMHYSPKVWFAMDTKVDEDNVDYENWKAAQLSNSVNRVGSMPDPGSVS